MKTALPAEIRRRLTLRRWVPYALLVLGCQLSLGAAWFVSSTDEARARTAFQARAQQTRQRIQSALNAYVEVVRTGTALLAASNEINFTEFRAFVTGLDLSERYRGLEGIGFAQRLDQPDVRSFVRAIRLDGVPAFRIWPANGDPELRPVLFFEPRASRSPTLVGFDMSTVPILQAAMDRARDTGQPAASNTLRGVRSVDAIGEPDFVLYIPVYRAGVSTETVEQRRRALIGFVFGPFRLEQVLPHIMMATAPSVAFNIHEGAGDAAALIYQSAAGIQASRFSSTETLQVAGRNWAITMKSFEGPVGVVSPAARRTLWIGLLSSMLLFLITRSQVRAWETAARYGAELRTSEQALRESEQALHQTIARERAARTQVEAADRAKDDFLATLSHELRTPLNTVLGWLTMLRTGSMREEQRSHALAVIERNARLQAQLIEDLLDVSRIVMGKVQLAVQPLAVAPIVSTVLESIRPAAEAKGVTLHPPLTSETGRISGDSSRVQQIVWNLLSNAVKFTPAGGHVSVELTQDDGHVVLGVRDTGMGIAPEFLPHVFERFRQADSSTTRTHSGVGLGLAIVRDLVELHGGSIEGRSDGPDKGSMFIVRFPTLPASSEAISGAVPANASPQFSGIRVLVVDDDAETRDLLSHALTVTGARVMAVETAREAYEQLRGDTADVLVSDIGMPEEDGYSLIRRVRLLPGDRGRIPAIALTAYAHPADRVRAMEAGFQMHFAKPVELAALQTGLAALTSRHVPDAADLT
jgi:signal transduction histidine kinase/CheY-like chemotaxis protein